MGWSSPSGASPWIRFLHLVKSRWVLEGLGCAPAGVAPAARAMAARRAARRESGVVMRSSSWRRPEVGPGRGRIARPAASGRVVRAVCDRAPGGGGAGVIAVTSPLRTFRGPGGCGTIGAWCQLPGQNREYVVSRTTELARDAYMSDTEILETIPVHPASAAAHAEAARRFPCRQCGAEQAEEVSADVVRCLRCGHEQPLTLAADAPIEEHDLQQELARQAE